MTERTKSKLVTVIIIMAGFGLIALLLAIVKTPVVVPYYLS